MSRYQSMLLENDVYTVEYSEERDIYIGTVFHPVTGREVHRMEAPTEERLRRQLIKYVYSTIPMSYEIY